MTTTHRGGSARTPRRPRATSTAAGLRAVAAAVAVVAAALVVILDPGAATVYAAHPMGPLRGPGEPAFVAAHRGDRSAAPENTIPAFEAAIAGGLAFVEADLQLTRDGQAVVMHDDTVDRTTDGSGPVGALTLAEVRALDAGSWYSDEFAGTRVPVLGEFLDLLARAAGSRVTALLELKGFWTEQDVRGLLSAVYLRGVQDRVVVASFHLGTLENAREAAPTIPRVVIQSALSADPVGLARFYGAIAVLTSADSVEDAPDVVAAMHDAGLGVLLYTLNTEQSWAEALALGVDGIVTDTPSALDTWIAATAPGT